MLYSQITDLNYFDLPEINYSELQILFIVDFWDGPKSGIILYNKSKYWFEMWKESEHPDYADYYRRFIVVELSNEQIEEEEYWKKLFKEKVRCEKELKPKSMWSEFYEPYKNRTPMDISKNLVIGRYQT